jgi:hypothetical protein
VQSDHQLVNAEDTEHSLFLYQVMQNEKNAEFKILVLGVYTYQVAAYCSVWLKYT